MFGTFNSKDLQEPFRGGSRPAAEQALEVKRTEMQVGCHILQRWLVPGILCEVGNCFSNAVKIRHVSAARFVQLCIEQSAMTTRILRYLGIAAERIRPGKFLLLGHEAQ